MSTAQPLAETVHGTAVAIGEHGVLLLGRPSSGKSDLALRLIDRGALLVADDRVRLTAQDSSILLTETGVMSGLLEIRGVGPCAMPTTPQAPFRLAVLCDAPPERLPTPEHRRWLGIEISALRLAALEASAAVKLEWALRAMVDGASAASKERLIR